MRQGEISKNILHFYGGVIMKKAMVFVLLILFAAGMVNAQDKVYRDNNLGLVFLFGGMSSTMLLPYNGGFGAKLNLGVIAIRPVIIFAMTNTKAPEVKDNPAWISDVNKMSVFGFGGSFLFNMASSGRIIPYVGAGAIVEFASTTNEAGHADGDDGDVFKTSQFGLGFHALIGFELFIIKNVSFSGEYRLGFGSSTTTNSIEWGDPAFESDDTASSMWGFAMHSSVLGIITVYIM